jgi:hypothetical protein
VLILLVALGMGACTHRNNEKAGEAARKAELTSQKTARELGKVARKAGQQLSRLRGMRMKGMKRRGGG